MNENYTMEDLKECFQEAIDYGVNFIGVKIQMEGFEKPEIIINPRENFSAKLVYYIKAYNDDLTLKANNGIKIVDFVYGDDFDDIQCELLNS